MRRKCCAAVPHASFLRKWRGHPRDKKRHSQVGGSHCTLRQEELGQQPKPPDPQCSSTIVPILFQMKLDVEFWSTSHRVHSIARGNSPSLGYFSFMQFAEKVLLWKFHSLNTFYCDCLNTFTVIVRFDVSIIRFEPFFFVANWCLWRLVFCGLLCTTVTVVKTSGDQWQTSFWKKNTVSLMK